MSFPTRTPLYGLHVHFRSVWVNAYNFRMYIQLSNMQPFEGNMYSIVWVFYMYLFFQIITHHYIFIFRSTRHPTNPPHNIYPTIYIYISIKYTHTYTHLVHKMLCLVSPKQKSVLSCSKLLLIHIWKVHTSESLKLSPDISSFHRIRTRFPLFH